ncbi:MAG TPA: alpha/beta fold hydrolase [Phenylobacterium sp.]|nr:alpha/beta fold hydrolase [Phenylobacterium sp.]
MVLEGGWRFVSFGDLVRRDVTTRFGVIALWSRPDIFGASAKPVVLVIGGSFSPAEDLKTLPDAVGILADTCIMRLPGAGAPPLTSLAIADVALAVGELVESIFPRRPVVLLGVSIGAVVALGVRAANIARVVAIEPPLVTGGLWPIVAPLREALGKTHDRLVHDMAFQTFGVAAQEVETRNYLAVLRGLCAPADVVLGETPLEPERPVGRFPSLVGAAERRELARNPRIRLHVAPGAGHNVIAQAPRFVLAIVLEASRRASAATPFDPAELDEPLLESTPLTARRVLYWGAYGETFRAAFRLPNPNAEVTLLGESDLDPAPFADEGFDAVVAAAPPPPELLARLAAVLRPGGHLIARWAEDTEALGVQLSPHGLQLREPVDDAGTGVIRAQKCDRGETPAAALHLKTVVFAALLMDIRTRLPARGLKSDPELQVAYETPPADLPPLARDTPKVLVMQRRAERNPDGWRPLLANAIRKGWIVVMEYDDHPRLVAEIKGTSASEADMLRFGFAHAVQTTTLPLVEAFRPYNPEVVMFPNSAFDLAPFPEGERPRRVVYGGVLRGDYPVSVARSLAPAIADHPDTEFVVIGDRAVFDALPTRRKQYHGYMSFEGYLRLMSECAISLSPIAPLPLRETKSDAKFIDGSRSGALTIASPTIYGRVIEHGVNGLLAPEIEDWAPLLSQALGDQALRSRLARKAWEYVRDERMFAGQIALRRDWYRDLWARREALNEAVMRRMPGLREMVAG